MTEEIAENEKKYEQYVNTRNEYYGIAVSEQNKMDSYAVQFSIAFVAAGFAYFSFISQTDRIFYIGLLYASWGFGGGALVSTYFSSFLAVKNAFYASEKVEMNFKEKGNVYNLDCSKYNSAIDVLNIVALLCLVFGFVSLCCFVYQNPVGKINKNCPCLTEIKNG